MPKKLLGVIGGMGALASADFYDTIINCTHAPTDQDHIDILLYSKASIPDRTEAIKNGEGKVIIDSLQAAYDKLSKAGADYVVMTCNTSYHFINSLQLNERTKFINMIDETVKDLKKDQVSKVGLLVTDGTVQSKTYENKLLENGIEVIYPSAKNQELLMDIIYKQIKAGKEPDEIMFNTISDELIGQDVEAIILGCTELSVYANLKQLDKFYIDPQEIVAKKCIVLCGGALKED